MNSLEAGQLAALSRRVASSVDPLALFEALATERRDAVLLESADAGGDRPVRSLVVYRSALRVEARGGRVELRALTAGGEALLATLRPRFEGWEQRSSREATVYFQTARDEPDEEVRLFAPSVLDVPRCLAGLGASGFVPLGLPVATGVFGYELIDNFEPLPPSPSQQDDGFPDYVFWVPEAVATIDHATHTTTFARLLFGPADGASLERQVNDARRELEHALATCERVGATSEPASGAAGGEVDPEAVDVDLDDAEYAELVRSLQDEIRAGEVFQIVPSRTFRAPCADPHRAYARLRAANPSPYMFLFDAGDFTLFGASPETAVQVKQGVTGLEVRLTPIAGTRPRGRGADGRLDLDADGRFEAELRLHEKENAEHMMLVDLARNDVARVSRSGTRYVSKLLEVVRYAHVMHLVSEVRGELRDGFDALRAYQACMNMGTLTGAPKVRAAQLLRERERTRRGPYGGAAFVLGYGGELDSSIVIRSALVRDGRAAVRAGAGVVFDSEPHLEALETKSKARAVLRSLQGGAA